MTKQKVWFNNGIIEDKKMSAKKRKTRNELLESMEKFKRNMQKIVDDGEITSISISSPSFENLKLSCGSGW